MTTDYNNYNISTTTVNPYNRYDEESFDEAKEKAKKLIEDLEDTIKRHEDREDGDVEVKAEEFLDNIKRFKFYSKGGLEVHFKREESLKLYLIGMSPKTVDLEKNYLRF